MATTFTLTGGIASLIGAPFAPKRAYAYIELANADDGIVDQGEARWLLGRWPLTLDAEGEFTVTLPSTAPGAGYLPNGGFLYRLVVGYRDSVGKSKAVVETSGAFELTGNRTLAYALANSVGLKSISLVEWVDFLAEFAGMLAAAAGSATSAAASAASAAASAALAEDISNIETPDALVETLVKYPSLTSDALGTQFANRADTATLSLAPKFDKVGVVLDRGYAPTATWMGIEGAAVIRDFDGIPVKIDGAYWLAYVGYGQTIDGQQRGTIGFAYATDLADAATYVQQNDMGFSFGPSMNPGDPDSDSVSGVCPVLDDAGTTLHLFYMGGTEPGGEQGTITMCHASAPLAGVLTGSPTWTRHGQVIGLGPAGTWTDTAIWKPRLLRDPKGTYLLLFFNASGTYLGVPDKERIGYAVSSTGINGPFAVTDTPILNIGRPGAWDDERIGDPSLEVIGDTVVMEYFGNAAGGLRPSDGLAWTTLADFPTGPGGGMWNKHPANPLLEPGPAGSFDVTAAHKPERVREVDGRRRLLHLYTAVGHDGKGDAADIAGQGFNIAAAVAASGPSGLVTTAPRLRFEQHTNAGAEIAISTTSWGDQLSGMDNYLTAKVGDVIEVGVSLRYGDEAAVCYLMPAFVKGGVPTSTLAAAAGAADGVAGWICSGGTQGNVSGSVHLVVTASDLDAGGMVRVRVRSRVTSGTKTIFGTTQPAHIWARNHGKANDY
ncbi:hypothetical protein LRP67_16205 [Nocardioides sp. cx-169]|uniref:hypothetical protein n=1 Tax=Nocardioides sp. cx-169 TaxID=2899080 RepID=UPI001E317C2D|nr:hypothetical protein [Nocardioides sp. cx-169]MCD4535636.1 hypothetical protein [Nocardioides sp. cx-169]